MEQIKVLKCEDKTTVNGKPYKALEVECQGEARKVSMWSFFPDFVNIKEGSVFMGKMTKGEKYWDLTYEGVEKPRYGQNNANKTASITKAMEKKEESIGKFQDNKEFSIMVASSMTNAVNLAIAEYRDKTVLDGLAESVLKWRQWILDNWEVDPKDIKPF